MQNSLQASIGNRLSSGSGPVRVKYVFLDIVGFTRGRSVEAQAALVTTLNEIIRNQAAAIISYAKQTIFLPTGDGVCIAIVEDTSFDSHVKLALKILAAIAEHNSSEANEMRRFQVRVGLNENVDNLVVDINGNHNLAGAGVNEAQRIMSAADPGQVMVGRLVYEVLRSREQHMKSFRGYAVADKHNQRFPVYQLVIPDCLGLDVSIPNDFKELPKTEQRLTPLMAHYVADAIAHRDLIKSFKDFPEYAYVIVVLLYFRALDSIEESERGEYESPTYRTWRRKDASFKEQFEYYRNNAYWLYATLHGYIIADVVESFMSCFEQPSLYSPTNGIFVNEKGRQKLIHEWPEIAAQYQIVTE